MVEVDAEKLGVQQQSVLAAGAEGAGEGAEVKVLGFVLACRILVGDGAERGGLATGIARVDDVAVDVRNGDAAQGLCITHGLSEEGEGLCLLRSEEVCVDIVDVVVAIHGLCLLS